MPIVPALMKHVVIPSVGAAAIGGGIAAAPAAMDLASGKAVRKATDRIISEGYDPETKQYDIGLGDRLFGEASKIFGGKGIDQESVKSRKQAIDLNDIKSDEAFSKTLGRLGVVPKAGDTKAGLRAKYNTEIADLGAADSLASSIKLQKGLADYQRGTPEALREKRLADETRNYMYFKDKQATQLADLDRQDRRTDRQADLEYRMADLSARKQIAQDNYNLQVQKMNREMKNDKKARIAQALAGLGSLGMMFAV
jgi:hypothetical protein